MSEALQIILVVGVLANAVGLGILIYAVWPRRRHLTPSQVEIVESLDGRRYQLVQRVGAHVKAMRIDGIGVMLLSEGSVKPQYAQIVRNFGRS